MIARTWHGRVPVDRADAYHAYLLRSGVADYTATPGNRGVHILRRREGDVTHFLLVTLWDSLDAIRAFAGDDHERARYYPEDDAYLLEREPRRDPLRSAADQLTPARDSRLSRDSRKPAAAVGSSARDTLPACAGPRTTDGGAGQAAASLAPLRTENCHDTLEADFERTQPRGAGAARPPGQLAGTTAVRAERGATVQATTHPGTLQAPPSARCAISGTTRCTHAA